MPGCVGAWLGKLAPPELDRTAGGNDGAVVRKVSEDERAVMRDASVM